MRLELTNPHGDCYARRTTSMSRRLGLPASVWGTVALREGLFRMSGPKRVVTLITDYGVADDYAVALTGLIFRMAP